MLRIERARPVSAHQVVVDEGPDVLVAQHLQGIDLVRGAEAVEEVDEGNARAQSGRLRDQRAVVSLLDRSRGQRGKARAAHRDHVGMVAEDGQRLRRHGARGDVEYRRGQLAGDLEHVRQHQQQALRGREGRRQRAGLQSTVHGAGRPALALHFLHHRNVSPQVLDTGAGPFVSQLRHGRGGRDGEDGADLVDPVGDVGHRRVAVHGCDVRGRAAHEWGSVSMSMAWQGHCSKQTAQPVQRA